MVFEVKPLTTKTATGKALKNIPYPLPQDVTHCSWVLCAPRKSGKSVVISNLLKVYSPHVECLLFSPTCLLDPNYKACAKMKNVFASESLDNEILKGVLEKQKERFMENPKNKALVIVDDFGPILRRKHVRAMMEVYWSTLRHYGCGLICAVQNFTQLEGFAITNALQYCIWKADMRQLKKIAETLASAHKDEKELLEFIMEKTKKKHSFVYIDFTKDDDDMYHVNFE